MAGGHRRRPSLLRWLLDLLGRRTRREPPAAPPRGRPAGFTAQRPPPVAGSPADEQAGSGPAAQPRTHVHGERLERRSRPLRLTPSEALTLGSSGPSALRRPTDRDHTGNRHDRDHTHRRQERDRTPDLRTTGDDTSDQHDTDRTHDRRDAGSTGLSAPDDPPPQGAP